MQGSERAVSQLNGRREGGAAELYIPLKQQAAEWGSAGHASPPAWPLPISGSDRCSRTGEGGTHRKRGTEVRGWITAADESRRRRLEKIQHVGTFAVYHATEHVKATVLDRSVQSWAVHVHFSGLKAQGVRTAGQRWCTAVFYPPGSPLMFRVMKSFSHKADMKMILI